MKIIDLLKQSQRGFSFEFFPYKTAKGKEQLVLAIEELNKYKPLYMSMTFGAGGSSQERTKDAVSIMLDVGNITAMPHLTCIGATKDSIQAIVADYKKMGIENIMALRGDIPKEGGINLEKAEFAYARDLIEYLKQINHLCIGAAVYPEGHIESASLELDMEYTKRKIDTGVDFAATQMFFDNKFYFEFCKRAAKKGIGIPIIPGILPVTDLNKLRQFISICRTTIPKELECRMTPFLNNPQEMEKVGVEFTIKQCKDLLAQGVKFLHFFTLNKADVVKQIIEAIKS